MNRIEQNGSRGLDRIVTPVGMGGSHEATYPPSERSGLATNLHESTRTGIRENPCPSVAKTSPRLYAHDGNKNVSEAVAAASGTNATVEVVAHYDYAAFGAVVAQKGDCAEANPWRFSSEYEDTDLGLDYYNYRHYEPMTGRWLQRDPVISDPSLNLYACGENNLLDGFDLLGAAFIVNQHRVGEHPGLGWPNYQDLAMAVARNVPDFSGIGFVSCGCNKIGIEVSPEDMYVDVYYKFMATVDLYRDEMDHVKCFRQYYEVYLSLIAELKTICDDQSIALQKAAEIRERLVAAALNCDACNRNYDSPGGPHGH